MRTPQIDPQKLRLVVAIGRQGSLSRVANEEGLSQSAVSKALAQCEAEWGGKLFLRTGRGMVLTDFGRSVLPRIQAWLDASQAMVDEFKELANTTAGNVRLATLPSLSSPIMGMLFSAVHSWFPRIKIGIVEGYAEQIEGWLESGHVDLGVSLRYDGLQKGVGIPLVDFDVYLCSAAGASLTSEPTVPFPRLDGVPLVIHNFGGVLHRYLEPLFRDRGMSLNVALEANSLSIQRDVVANSGVYALLSYNAVAQDVRSGRIQASRLIEPAIVQHLDLAYARHGPISSAAREVGRQLQAVVRAGVDQGLLRR
ncbi:LysR family transcriptional regulator [Pigmentiphaga sp. GD03639]|uniref:LysR family transcriptional regulator n=1 Tax=unclassified Pigmentiphaga TaxID=2626614 RepID=UPI0024491F04|nr:LysR family transcriptional regulator [Pigmentiphaga sp. GD03639]MDH2235162.1 LysR family transcriptional regulator [Pigmentiphaga sp. GD03639]